eukprot:Em0001g803a
MLTDQVAVYRAAMSQKSSLVNCGDYIELVAQQNDVLYGILLAVFKLQDSTYCLVQSFQQVQSFGGTPLLNEYDCPRLDLTTAMFSTPGKKIKRAVSTIHDCDTSCCFRRTETVEYCDHFDAYMLTNLIQIVAIIWYSLLAITIIPWYR